MQSLRQHPPPSLKILELELELEDDQSSSTITSESAPSTSTSKTQGVLPSSITKTDTLQAKILWCLKVVEDHQSFHSCLENNQLSQWMFPDSAIAKNFQLSESKCKYMTVFGLGPYVQDILRVVPTSRRALIMSFFKSESEVAEKANGLPLENECTISAMHDLDLST